MTDFTRQISITTSGGEIVGFDVSDIQTLLIISDTDFQLYTGRNVEGNGAAIKANQAVTLGHQDFDDLEKRRHTKKMLSGKTAAGTATVSVMYMGRGSS